MRMKAKAYQQYGDAAIMALVLESLPSIAKQVAKPLEKVRHLGDIWEAPHLGQM